MPVIINLKTTLENDTQYTLTDKINFNFNQILSLGIGQPGPIGEYGPAGDSGYSGNPGDPGPRGNIFFSTFISSNTPPSSYPSGMRAGDILINKQAIYNLDTFSHGVRTWSNIVNFSAISVGSLSGIFRQISRNSRIIKPNITTGEDLTNSIVSTDPAYQEPGKGKNYQTVLYNFNEQNTYSLKSNGGTIQIESNLGTYQSFNSSTAVNISDNSINIASHGFSTGELVVYLTDGGTPIGGLVNNSQYYVIFVDTDHIKLYNKKYTSPIDLTSVGSGTHKFTSISPDPDRIFPATSNLAVYSIYDSTATSAGEFKTSAKGFRGQVELGSIDSISTNYPGVTVPLPSFSYLVSPGFENLKIRKYKLAGNSGWSTDYTGRYFLRAEYDISSSGSTDTETYSPRRHSEHSWIISKAGQTYTGSGTNITMRLTNSEILNLTGDPLLVDGIFLKNQNPAFISSFAIGFDPVDQTKIKVKSSSQISKFEFSQLAVALTDGLNSVYLNIDANGDFEIVQPDTVKRIRLNRAIIVKGSKLDYGLPFPVNTSISIPVTILSSADHNTLYEYKEVNFTPVINWGTFTSGTGYQTSLQLGSPKGKMTKIGNQVSLDITFSLRAVVGSSSLGSVYQPPYYSDPFETYVPSYDINFPTSSVNIHPLGNEAYPIVVRGIPNTWPDILNGGDKMKFKVSLVNLTDQRVPVLRSWPLTYKDSTGTLTSLPWLPIDYQSIYAQLGVYDPGSSINYPQLALKGYRKDCTVVSNLSIADFLNPSLGLEPGVPGTLIQVSISGTYLTDHNSAETDIPWTTPTTTLPPATPSSPLVVTALSATSITNGAAIISGTITYPGTQLVTEDGLVYSLTSTNANPTIGGTGCTKVVATLIQIGTFSISAISLSVNSQYSYKAYATNSVGTGYGSAASFWTLANTPTAPSLVGPLETSVDVSIGTGDGNPSITTYSIACSVSGSSLIKYVQANGSLGTSPVYQTSAVWGSVTVTGLTATTSYDFYTTGKNGAGVLTANSPISTISTASPAPLLNSEILNTFDPLLVEAPSILDWEIHLNGSAFPSFAYTRPNMPFDIPPGYAEIFNWSAAGYYSQFELYFTLTQPNTGFTGFGTTNYATLTIHRPGILIDVNAGAGVITCLNPGINTYFKARWLGVTLYDGSGDDGGVTLEVGPL